MMKLSSKVMIILGLSAATSIVPASDMASPKPSVSAEDLEQALPAPKYPDLSAEEHVAIKERRAATPKEGLSEEAQAPGRQQTIKGMRADADTATPPMREEFQVARWLTQKAQNTAGIDLISLGISIQSLIKTMPADQKDNIFKLTGQLIQHGADEHTILDYITLVRDIPADERENVVGYMEKLIPIAAPKFFFDIKRLADTLVNCTPEERQEAMTALDPILPKIAVAYPAHSDMPFLSRIEKINNFISYPESRERIIKDVNSKYDFEQELAEIRKKRGRPTPTTSSKPWGNY